MQKIVAILLALTLCVFAAATCMADENTETLTTSDGISVAVTLWAENYQGGEVKILVKSVEINDPNKEASLKIVEGDECEFVENMRITNSLTGENWNQVQFPYFFLAKGSARIGVCLESANLGEGNGACQYWEVDLATLEVKKDPPNLKCLEPKV